VLLSAVVVALGPTLFVQFPLNATYPYASIDLNYTFENATYCNYELTNSSGIFNTTLPSCQNTTLAGITEGQNSVRVWANDSANNWNVSGTVYFSLDTHPPVWTEVPSNRTVEYNTSFGYGVNAFDPSGVDRYWISDSTNFTINSSSGLITNNTLLAIGVYLLNVSVNDTLGNTNSTLFAVKVMFDATSPTINMGSPQFANYTTDTPNLSVTTSENTTIIYNWGGAGNISGCRNCTAYNSTYGELVSDSDTLLLLHFNENYGNAIYDQTGRYNGTRFGANWTAGRFGYGLAFDGTAKNVTLPASVTPSAAFTIEVWVNATGSSNYMAIVDKYAQAGVNGYGYSLYLNYGKPTFTASNYPSWGPLDLPINYDIRNTGWHYVAVIYTGSTLKIFLDNTSVTSTPSYSGGVAASAVNLTIGNRANNSWYFNGTIDEFRLTNRTLSDSELAANRNRRLADGAHNITVYATDGAGNTNASFTRFNTDVTLPFCTFLSVNLTYFRNGTPLNFTVFCNDTSSGVSFVYLNVTAIGGGIVQMSPSGGGNYTHSLAVDNNRSESVNVSIYNVTDAYGNTNSSNLVLALTADNTNPAVYMNMPLNQSWQKGTVFLNYSATDTQTIGVCIWRWQNSSGVWNNYTGLACGSGLAFQFDTTKCYDDTAPLCSLELFANDSAGNYNSSELYLRIDNNPPNITELLPLNNSVLYSNTTRISFNVTDVASGVNISLLTINDTQSLYNNTNISCTPISNGYNCSLSLVQTDGPKQITIFVYDNLSNFAQSKVYYTVGTCQYPASGNWALNYTQSCANRTIILNGNLTVQSTGNLTFRNVTLLLNGTYNGSRKIEALGGVFYILDNDGIQSTNDGSNITTLNTSNRLLFMVGANSTFEMRNSELSYVGYAAAALNETGVYLAASNIHITGTALSNNFNALVGVTTNGTFENNTIHSNSGAGIQLVSNGSVFLNNKIFGNGLDGLALINSSNSVLSYNNISSNNRAVRLSGSSNNTLLNNTLSSNTAEGLYLYASQNNSILNNTLNSNSGGGIYVEHGSDNNLIQYNNLTSNNYGLQTYNSTGNSMLSNTFVGNSQYGIGMGLTTFSTISNNTITSTNFEGLYLQYSDSNNFSGNTISGSQRRALYADNSHNNSFAQDAFGGHYGLSLSSSHNNAFAQSTVSSVLEGIELAASSNNTFTSATITSSSGPDLSSKVNSTNTFLNSTYSSSKTYFDDGNSKIFRQWYMRITTVNTTGSPVNNTDITIFDNLSATVFVGQTGADGSALIPITESTVSTTTTNYTPHRIAANISGYFGNASANMNQGRELTVVLTDTTPPQLLAQSFEPSYIYPNGTTTFLAHIWENVRVSYAWIGLATPNGTYNYTLAYESQNSTGQNWVAQITNTSRFGQYNLSYFFINDTNGNNNSPAVSAYFRVQSDLPPNITFSETNTPNIEVNAPITISANITDDYNTTSAYLSVFQPVNATASMAIVSGNRTAGAWQANYIPTLIGTYQYLIVANDNSSNTAYSRQYSFNSTTYNCTSVSRVFDPINCVSVGCLWTVGAFGVCSFYNSTADKNTFELTLNSDSTQIVLTNNNALGRLSSTTNRNASLNITMNSISLAVPIPLSANIPREFAVLTNGLLISPENSTILSTAYSDYKLSSVINGSGNRSAFAYTSTFGQPATINLDNNTVLFTYNASTKLANFTITLGSPHTLDILFTQPCAPSGGQCGTCCSGLSCCSGICGPTCSASSPAPQSPSGTEQRLPVKSVSISTSATRIETKVGVHASFTVTVKNTGTENLTAVSLGVANLTRGWFSIAPSAQNFPVGHEATYSVTVNPSLEGTYNFSIYVPTPRSEYIPMALIVTNDIAQQSNPTDPANGATQLPDELQIEIQALEQLASQIAENITNAKTQGANTSAIEKTLEDARLALAEGKPDKAKLLMEYIQSELPKLKTNQAAGGAPIMFIALIALSVLGFIVARYKDQFFPKKAEGVGEIITFSRETESAPQDKGTRLSNLRSKVIAADNAIDSGNIQKAEELYSALQKEYDDLVLNSVSADAQTISALNEAHASIERLYEQLTKK